MLFLIVAGVLIVGFVVTLIVAVVLRIRNRAANAVWQRHLLDMGFRRTAAAIRAATDVSASPGTVRKAWELERRDVTVLRYLKHVRSIGPRSNVSVNRITEEVWWPRSDPRARGAEIILGFGTPQPSGRTAKAVLNRMASSLYGDQFTMCEPTRQLGDAGVSVVLFDGADADAWPSMLPGGVTDLLEKAAQVGIEFVRFSDDATCIGLDRESVSAEPKERWELLRALSEAR